MISIGDKVVERSLSSLVQVTDRIIRPLGFNLAGRDVWERKATWKIEEVDLGVEGALHFASLPSFRVLLPRTRTSTGDTHHYVAQANVSKILRPDQNPKSIRVPSISLLSVRFVRFVTADIESAMPWFDQFATPESCIANLNKFLKPDCPAFVDAEQFLNSLMQRKSTGSTLRT